MSAYIGQSEFEHGQADKSAVLLLNLGTPAAPTRQALRRYLKQFLSDPRVVEVPKLIWWLVLNGIILNTRPAKSARAYQTVWTEAGSPLLNYSMQQRDAVQTALNAELNTEVRVELAMRYGQPSVESILASLLEDKVQRLLVLPLYPQYSAATTGSAFDAVADTLKRWRWVPELRFINHYHDHSAYTGALADCIERHWAEHGRPDKLLFSYHGIPRDYFEAGDPYHCHCYKTTRLVVEQLGLADGEYLQSFQSRFGPRQWLRPYTDETLKQWGTDGVKHVQVICPGFAADCLETIEEIDIQNRAFFLAAGGERFSYIPALNDEASHIAALVSIIQQHTQGWPEFSRQFDQAETSRQNALTKQRALAMGAGS